MSQRQERHTTRLEDLEPEAVESAVAASAAVGDLPGFDLELAPFDPPAGEPDDPLAATPALTREDPLREFSDNARKRYELEVSSFAADLRRQSLAHQRATGGGSVSGRDVTSAASFLRSYRPSGLLTHVGAIGGVLIGLGVQSLVSMVDKGVYPTGGVLWGVGAVVAGVTLFVWQATRDRT